jgi:hypothetical protein
MVHLRDCEYPAVRDVTWCLTWCMSTCKSGLPVRSGLGGKRPDTRHPGRLVFRSRSFLSF